MLTETDIVGFIQDVKKSLEDGIRKNSVSYYPMREITTVFSLAGRLKREPKYVMYADIFGSLTGVLMRFPPDFSNLVDDKDNIRSLLQKIPKFLDEFALALGKDSQAVYESLQKLALLTDDMREMNDRISRRLPKELPTA